MITVDNDGNIKMSIVLNNKCYTKGLNQGINEIQVSSNIDSCVSYSETILNGSDP